MVVNIIYPWRYWAVGPWVCRDTWHSWLCFRPHSSLSPESHVRINPQNSKTHSNKSTQFDQVSSYILDLCCGCSKKSLNDPDCLVIRVPCAFYIAGFVCIRLFYQPCAQHQVSASLAMDSYISFAKSGQVQFSLVLHWGQRGDSKPHWTVLYERRGFGLEIEGQIYSGAANRAILFFTWEVAVCLVWATCYSNGWRLLPPWPPSPGWLQPACKFLCRWGLWENAEKSISLFKLQPSTERDCNCLCHAEYKKDPELRAGAGGCCHHWNNNQWQQTIAFVC